MKQEAQQHGKSQPKSDGTRRAGRRTIGSLLGGILVAAALLAWTAHPVAAQKSDIKIRGNVQFLYGQWDVSAPNNDPTAQDIDGAMMSTESNIFFQGTILT